MSDNTVVIGNRTFKAVPTSCRCGGSWAWVEVEDGKHTMIGCVCHNTLPVNVLSSHIGKSGIIALAEQLYEMNSNKTTYEFVFDDQGLIVGYDCPAHERDGV